MLTLQMTAGNNSDTIWCLRLRGEGTNLVTLGDFSADTGWTMTGDWVIGSGVATYSYVDDVAGNLERTISAVSAIPYVLEYEIKSVDTLPAQYTLYLIGGGDYIVSGNILLDCSLGKHSTMIQAVATKTKIGFLQTGGATATFDFSIDNISLREADNIIRIATRDLSLDSGTAVYDGQVLNHDNYLSEISFPSTIQSGGGTGAVTSFSFSISRHVSNAAFNSFFNELYPATDAGYLVSRIADLGVCWVGATTEAEITWLLRSRAIDYDYEQRKLNFTVFQESELTNKEIPYYSVQKDFNNGVSYFTHAGDNYGAIIPIVYGSFNVDTFDYDLKRIAPSVCVDKTYLIFIQASHKLYTQNSPTYTDALYKYIDGIDSYMVLIPDNGDSVNNNISSTVRLLSSTRTSGELLRGKLFVVFKSTGSLSDINNVSNILDRTESTYLTLADTNILSLIIGDNINQSEIGTLGRSATTDIQVQISWQSDDGGNRGLYISYHNLSKGNTATTGSANTTTNTGGTWATDTFDMAENVEEADDATLPYTIDDLRKYEFIVQNTSGATATSGSLNVRQAVLIFSNIIVSGYVNKYRDTIYDPRRSGNRTNPRGIR